MNISSSSYTPPHCSRLAHNDSIRHCYYATPRSPILYLLTMLKYPTKEHFLVELIVEESSLSTLRARSRIKRFCARLFSSPARATLIASLPPQPQTSRTSMRNEPDTSLTKAQLQRWNRTVQHSSRPCFEERRFCARNLFRIR